MRNRPVVITVSGLPGSGKSTLAESLAEKLVVPLLSVDPIESAILRSGIGRSFETGLAAYMVAEDLAGEQLKCGLSVIIDAVNGVQEARDMWHGLAKRYGVGLIVLECVVEREIHKRRIESRVRDMHGIPEVTWEDVEERREEYLVWEEERLVVDTGAATLEENVERALAYISSHSIG